MYLPKMELFSRGTDRVSEVKITIILDIMINIIKKYNTTVKQSKRSH